MLIGNVRQIVWLFSRSVQLDVQLLFVPEIAIRNKIIFITRKYISIVKAAFMEQNSVKKGVSFRGEFFFRDEFATGLLQSIYCNNYHLRKMLPASPVIVDIGANIGQFYEFAAQYLGAQQVVSFEPLESCFKVLRMNSRHTVIHAAVGAENGERTLWIDDRDIFASLVAPVDPPVGRVSTEHVAVRRLDDVPEIRSLKHIDLVKIDIEGYELTVIKNSPQTLKKTDAILIECSVNRPSAGGIGDVIAFMSEYYPEFTIVDVGNIMRRHEKIEWLEVLWKRT